MTQYLYILLSLRIVTVTRDTTQYVLTTTRTRTHKKKSNGSHANQISSKQRVWTNDGLHTSSQ
jgi:hypothetical protein